MPTLEQIQALGHLVREARTAKELTLEQAEELSGVKRNYLWTIEQAYVLPNRSPTIPSDDVLEAVAAAFGIPVVSLHAALGRVPAGSPAVQLVREKLAEYGGQDHAVIDLTAEQMDQLIDDVEGYAEDRLSRTLRQSRSQYQYQGGGKQLQRQG